MIDLYTLIQSNFDTMSSSKRAIAKIVLYQQQNLSKYTISRLAKEANVSNAMIIKFAKSLGLEGFDELKFLAKYNQSEDRQLTDSDYLNEIIKTLHVTNKHNRSQNPNLLRQMQKKQNIYILARSSSANIAFDFYYRLAKIRTNVYFERDAEKQMQLTDIIDNNDLIFLVSNSGNCTELLRFLNKLQTRTNTESVLITNNRNGKLAAYATHIFAGISLEADPVIKQNVPCSSKYSLMYMLDSIFFDYFHANYKTSIEMIHQKELHL